MGDPGLPIQGSCRRQDVLASVLEAVGVSPALAPAEIIFQDAILSVSFLVHTVSSHWERRPFPRGAGREVRACTLFENGVRFDRSGAALGPAVADAVCRVGPGQSEPATSPARGFTRSTCGCSGSARSQPSGVEDFPVAERPDVGVVQGEDSHRASVRGDELHLEPSTARVAEHDRTEVSRGQSVVMDGVSQRDGIVFFDVHDAVGVG